LCDGSSSSLSESSVKTDGEHHLSLCDREKYLTCCVQELKGLVAPDSSLAIGQKCLQMAEVSAAGKFFDAGVKEIKQSLSKTEIAMKDLVSSINSQMTAKDQSILYLENLVTVLQCQLEQHQTKLQ
jgi:hypothetical protein